MTPTQQILLAMLDEIQQLRASLDVVSGQVPNALTLGEAREAKSQALQANHDFYNKLRIKVEGLAR